MMNQYVQLRNVKRKNGQKRRDEYSYKAPIIFDDCVAKIPKENTLENRKYDNVLLLDIENIARITLSYGLQVGHCFHRE
jgi:hypothetical protein